MTSLKSAGIISMGGYLPAKEVPGSKQKQLVAFLKKETLLYPEYIHEIEEKGLLPGRIETNYDGWESQPWFDAWLEKLPPKKRENPFQGAKERRRVPMDPAVVGEVEEGYGYISSYSSSIGARHKAIIFQERKPELPVTTKKSPSYEQEFVTFYNQEFCKEIAHNAANDMAKVVHKTIAKAGYGVEDIDFFVCHQPVPWAANAWREAVGENHIALFHRASLQLTKNNRV